jgi:hypothetical protein
LKRQTAPPFQNKCHYYYRNSNTYKQQWNECARKVGTGSRHEPRTSIAIDAYWRF